MIDFNFTKLEGLIYNKVINRKWEEIEAKLDELGSKELNPIIITEIFKEKRWSIAKKLLSNNNIKDINIRSVATNDTLLMMTLQDTSERAQEISKILIDKGAKKDSVNYNGLTALMVACENNNVKMFKYLLENGDDINKVTGKSTVFLSAVKNGNKDIVSYFLKNSKIINFIIDGENALSIAIKRENEEMVKMLIYGGLYILNKHKAVDYLINIKDIDLICHILKNNQCDIDTKDDIIKAMLKEYNIDNLLEIKDDKIREDIIRVFFENKYRLSFTNNVINKLLQSDLKEYVRDNYNEYIKAHMVDVYSNNRKLEEDIKEIDKIDVILKSCGVKKDVLAKYILILSLEKIYKKNVDNFEISQDEFEALIAYQLMNSMEDNIFRNKYKEFYLKKIMPIDSQIIERLEGKEKKDYIVNNVYNWFMGNKIYKDDIYSLNCDITKLINSNLVEYNINDLDIVKRAPNDKKEYVKDVLNYTVLAIRYLGDKIINGQIKNLKDVNDALVKRDNNLRVLQYILNDKELPQKNVMPQNNILTQSYMNWAIDNSYVFIRGILNASEYSDYCIHNETNIDIELRKGFRKIGKSTLTKIIGNKDGNLNRSCTMINFGSRVFTEVGLGIINPDINDIKLVASHNIGTGKGKKATLTRLLKGDSIIDNNDTIENQLKVLKDYLKRGWGSRRHNEVVMDINLNKDNICVFYYNNNRAIDFLNAAYVKIKYMKKNGKNIPIFRIDKNYHYPVKEKYNLRKIKQCLKEAFSNNTSEILDVYNIDFLICFKDEIKRIPECKVMVEQFIKGAECRNVNDCINISKLIGAYQSKKEQDEYINRHIHKYIRKENYISFMKEKLQINYGARRKDREIDFFIETMDNIAQLASKGTIENIKGITCDTFKKVCEYAIKRKHTVDIEGLFKKCENKAYLTLDDKTKDYIIDIKEERDIKEREFYKEYNITPKI